MKHLLRINHRTVFKVECFVKGTREHVILNELIEEEKNHG